LQRFTQPPLLEKLKALLISKLKKGQPCSAIRLGKTASQMIGSTKEPAACRTGFKAVLLPSITKRNKADQTQNEGLITWIRAFQKQLFHKTSADAVNARDQSLGLAGLD